MLKLLFPAQTAEETVKRLQQRLDSAETRAKSPPPPAADERLAGGFVRGDRVTWIKSDSAVPTGSIGTVQDPSSKGGDKLQVQFPRGLYSFPASELRLAASGRPPPAAAHVAVPIPAVPVTNSDAPIWIEGHPGQEYNGLYLKCVEGVRDVHGGWPVYKRDVDKKKDVRYCYRHGTKSPKWMLHEKYTPNEAVCNAQIDGSAGPVPAGERSWSVYSAVKRKWVYHKLTITPLVRSARPCLWPLLRANSLDLRLILRCCAVARSGARSKGECGTVAGRILQG